MTNFRTKYILLPLIVAVPWGMDEVAKANARNQVMAVCAKTTPGIPVPSGLGGIGLDAASFPGSFEPEEANIGASQPGVRASHRFSKVWREHRTNSGSTRISRWNQESLFCDSHEDFESCLTHYSNDVPIYRFTTTRLRLREFPSTQSILVRASRVRLWKLEEEKPIVLAMWTSITAAKSSAWTILTFWSDAHLHKCTSGNISFVEWLRPD